MRTVSTNMLSQRSKLVDTRALATACSDRPGTWHSTAMHTATSTTVRNLATAVSIETTAVHFATKGTKPYVQRPKETLR